MGLFNFLNKKKEQIELQELLRLQRESTEKCKANEQQRQTESRRCDEEHHRQELVRQQTEEKRKQNKALNNNEQSSNTPQSAAQIKEPNTNMLPTNEAVSEQLQHIASQANWLLNTGNQQATINYMNALFDACYGRNGYRLLQISDDTTQVVGLAFTSIARHLDFNDPDMNSVAAENALYCLARNIIATGNTYCAPAIFTLLLIHPDLLKDKLIAAHCEIAQEDVGMPIGLMLGGNPFNAPHLNSFREQAISKRIPIMAYILQFFYDEVNQEYSIPTDMPYHIPSQSDINRYTKMKSEYGGTNNSILTEGKRYFYQIFQECQNTLLKTKSM